MKTKKMSHIILVIYSEEERGGDGRAVVERLSRNRWYVYINERWFTSASGILLPAFVTSSSS